MPRKCRTESNTSSMLFFVCIIANHWELREAQNRPTMFWGILIGVALTVLTAVLAVVLGKKEFSFLSYIVVIVALICFSLEGIKYITAVKDKTNAVDKAENMAAIAESVIAIAEYATDYGKDVQNYRLGIAEASAIKTGLKNTYPEVARYLETSDLIGKTISESPEVFRKSIIHSANHRIWTSVAWMIGTLVVSILLIILSTNKGGIRRKGDSTVSVSSDDSYTSSSSYDDF